MARDLELWQIIRADFLATGLSYPQLAKKYGVSISSLKKVAAKESWMQDRAAINLEAAKRNRGTGTGGTDGTATEPEPIIPEDALAPLPTVAEIIEGKADRLEKFMKITDAMMDRILSAMESPEVVSPYSLKLLASTLRDLREMQGLNKSALDLEEQMARIAKLKSETRIVEENGDSGVIILPAIDETLTPPECEDG